MMMPVHVPQDALVGLEGRFVRGNAANESFCVLARLDIQHYLIQFQGPDFHFRRVVPIQVFVTDQAEFAPIGPTVIHELEMTNRRSS